jgi:hypothetical protein
MSLSLSCLSVRAIVTDLSNDPFRSLAGAVRESCGFEKDNKSASSEDYLEFHITVSCPHPYECRKRMIRRHVAQIGRNPAIGPAARDSGRHCCTGL